MKSLLNFAPPEALPCISKEAQTNITTDAITGTIERASPPRPLPDDHAEGDTPRLSHHPIASVLWDVHSMLGLIKTLAMQADAASTQNDSIGGAK